MEGAITHRLKENEMRIVALAKGNNQLLFRCTTCFEVGNKNERIFVDRRAAVAVVWVEYRVQVKFSVWRDQFEAFSAVQLRRENVEKV